MSVVLQAELIIVLQPALNMLKEALGHANIPANAALIEEKM